MTRTPDKSKSLAPTGRRKTGTNANAAAAVGLAITDMPQRSIPVEDGELDCWIPVVVNRGGPVVAVVGIIRGDRKNRWEDGTLIITSMIRDGEVIAAGNVIRTLNSTYRLLGQFIGAVTAHLD